MSKAICRISQGAFGSSVAPLSLDKICRSQRQEMGSLGQGYQGHWGGFRGLVRAASTLRSLRSGLVPVACACQISFLAQAPGPRTLPLLVYPESDWVPPTHYSASGTFPSSSVGYTPRPVTQPQNVFLWSACHGSAFASHLHWIPG